MKKLLIGCSLSLMLLSGTTSANENLYALYMCGLGDGNLCQQVLGPYPMVASINGHLIYGLDACRFYRQQFMGQNARSRYTYKCASLTVPTWQTVR